VNIVIEPIVKGAAGLDVHQGSVMCTVLAEQNRNAPRWIAALHKYGYWPPVPAA
jgi:hypothetical protein